MKLRAQAGVRGVCVGGVEYANDAEECVDVPAIFVADVCGAGYDVWNGEPVVPVLVDVVEPAQAETAAG